MQSNLWGVPNGDNFFHHKFPLSERVAAESSEVPMKPRRPGSLCNWHILKLNKFERGQSCEKCEKETLAGKDKRPLVYVYHVQYGHWTQTKTEIEIKGMEWNFDSQTCPHLSHVIRHKFWFHFAAVSFQLLNGLHDSMDNILQHRIHTVRCAIKFVYHSSVCNPICFLDLSGRNYNLIARKCTFGVAVRLHTSDSNNNGKNYWLGNVESRPRHFWVSLS